MILIKVLLTMISCGLGSFIGFWLGFKYTVYKEKKKLKKQKEEQAD